MTLMVLYPAFAEGKTMVGDSRGPHRSAVETKTTRERFLVDLFDRLWEVYRRRVRYVATYEQVIAQHKATFFNDHIAFRTFACQNPCVGICTLGRVFEALGYRAAGNYQFDDKFLAATHFQHENPALPKLFVSELQLWRLPPLVRESIQRLLANHRDLASDTTLSRLQNLDDESDFYDSLMLDAIHWFTELPWRAAPKSDVLAANAVSQYAAWVMVHGYAVNHFTSLINSHQVSDLDTIEKTIAALQAAGVPMKTEIEGAVGTKLRQTATEAATIDVQVRDGDKLVAMPWTYAYFELAQRDPLLDPTTGKKVRFEGFLGPQATNLFEMTRVGKS
jgi:hypothetical protein